MKIDKYSFESHFTLFYIWTKSCVVTYIYIKDDVTLLKTEYCTTLTQFIISLYYDASPKFCVSRDHARVERQKSLYASFWYLIPHGKIFALIGQNE